MLPYLNRKTRRVESLVNILLHNLLSLTYSATLKLNLPSSVAPLNIIVVRPSNSIKESITFAESYISYPFLYLKKYFYLNRQRKIWLRIRRKQNNKNCFDSKMCVRANYLRTFPPFNRTFPAQRTWRQERILRLAPDDYDKGDFSIHNFRNTVIILNSYYFNESLARCDETKFNRR